MSASGSRSSGVGIALRRRWRGLCLAVFLGCARGGSAPAPADDPVFDWIDLGEGLYASVVREGVSPSEYAASLVVVNADHVVVVDARDTPSAARDLIARIRATTPLPVRYLVNTHWHGDHVHGNHAFREAFPGLRVVGHPYTAGAIAGVGEERRAAQIEGTAQRIERLQRWLAEGRSDDGPVGAADSAAIERALADRLRRLEEYRAVVPVPPTDLVTDSLVLRAGRRTITIVHPGPAHTPGDLVLEIQPDSLLVVGDLIEEGFPYLADGSVAGSARAMADLLSRPVTRVFGAHVRRLEDRSRLESQQAFLAELVRLVAEARARGADVERAIAGVRMETFRRGFTAGDSAREARYGEFVAGLARQAFLEGSR